MGFEGKVLPLDKKTTINHPEKKIVVNEVRDREASQAQLDAIKKSKKGNKVIND